jgi:predicted translin family RNA/ssDNA-binding protein
VIGRNKKILVGQRSALNRRAGSLSTEDYVKALSDTVGELSREIVETLLAFDKQGKS